MNQPVGFHFLQKLIYRWSKWYFRAEIKGLENIPTGPCLFVGNHNAIAALSPEIWIFGSAYFESRNSLKVLGHDLALKVPGISYLAKKYLKYIPNNHESAKKSLREGSQVLVFPGGGWESCRPSSLRDQIDFKHRSGFIKLAREAEVPIVPLVTTGGHDGVYIWKRGGRIANALKFNRIFRIDTFPIGISLPCVLHLGPFMPFFPLPRKVILEVMAPVKAEDLRHGDDKEKATDLILSMQKTMDRNVKLLPRALSDSRAKV